MLDSLKPLKYKVMQDATKFLRQLNVTINLIFWPPNLFLCESNITHSMTIRLNIWYTKFWEQLMLQNLGAYSDMQNY